jgi:hypothetical protein
MKNKNLILLLAAGAAYWYFFMYKKKKQALPPVIQPGMPDVPGSSTPAAAQTQPGVTTEAVSIVDQIKSFSEPMRQLEHKQDEDAYQTFYVKQISGVKRVGVPYTV